MAGERQLTSWRQGYVLTTEHAKKLGVAHPKANDDPLTIVVTNDCDLEASEKVEPDCELIPGIHIEKLIGTYTNSKHPRRLHLAFSAGETLVYGEFAAP